MTDKSKAQETAEKYIAKMKAAKDEAKKAFEKSMSQLDVIGNEMYEDMRVNLKDSGVDLDKMQAKLKVDLIKGKDEMTKEFWHIESRLVRFGEDVENEIRKTFKQS